MVYLKDLVSGECLSHQIVNGTAYEKDTPIDLVNILEELRQTKERVRIIYGDVLTGSEWNNLISDRGTIGRSSGTIKVPILIRTSRSLGGEHIMDHCILRILKSKGGQVIYQRKVERNGSPEIQGG